MTDLTKLIDKPWEFGLGGVANDCRYKIKRRHRNGYSETCDCGRCDVCGFPLHSAVHMHPYGGKAGDAPFDHRFVPRRPR